jgi:ABC-type nitrate/sulfonate/bicarbonate transport system substrate-binding protein
MLHNNASVGWAKAPAKTLVQYSLLRAFAHAFLSLGDAVTRGQNRHPNAFVTMISQAILPTLRILAIFACSVVAMPHYAWAQVVTVGATSSTSDAPIYIADKKGYFQAEGLQVKVINFRSAADMVAPLGAGEIAAGAGSASAGLYNAVARGIRIKIVADKASSPPGYGATKILLRRDHVDSGRYKELKDLKGMKFAMNAPGVSNTSTLNTLLASAGLKYSDVETVDLPLPDHLAALKNKSVDASASVEPAPAIAMRSGDAVLVKSDDEILPYHQIAVLLYGEEFALRQPDAARRFMPRIYPCGALLQRRAQGRQARWAHLGRGDRNPLRGHADQGPRHLQVDHADRHEPARQSEQGEPPLRSRILSGPGADQGQHEFGRCDRQLIRGVGAQCTRAIPLSKL